MFADTYTGHNNFCDICQQRPKKAQNNRITCNTCLPFSHCLPLSGQHLLWWWVCGLAMEGDLTTFFSH